MKCGGEMGDGRFELMRLRVVRYGSERVGGVDAP